MVATARDQTAVYDVDAERAGHDVDAERLNLCTRDVHKERFWIPLL